MSEPEGQERAHFLVGKDYEKQKKSKEARREFSAVEEGSLSIGRPGTIS